MTPKISYTKFIQEELKQRFWLIAVLTTTMFLLQPLMLIVGINERKVWLSDVSLSFTKNDLQNWLTGFIGFDNNTFSGFIVLSAVLCGISGYYFLHTKEKLDLINSLPIRREKTFFIQFISGGLIFILPFTLNLLISFLGISFQGLLTPQVLFSGLASFGVHLLFFFFLYTVTIFSMVVTGRLLVGLLGTILLFLYGSIVLSLFRMLAATFFTTYYFEFPYYGTFTIYLHSRSADGFSSPLLCFISTLRQMQNHHTPWSMLLFAFVMTLFFLTVSLIAYQKRPTEAAGNSIAFSYMEPFLKVLFSVPLGLYGAFYLSSFPNQGYEGPFFFLLVLFCTLIFAFVIEFIYRLDIRLLFQKKAALFASCILVLGITAFYRFDLPDYDSYLPKKDRIESMSVYMDSFCNRFYAPYQNEIESAKNFLDSVSLKEFDSIYDLAQTGARTSDAGKSQTGFQLAVVKYNLKSGREIYRNYYVPEQTVNSCMKKIFSNQQYKEALFAIDKYDSQKVTSIEFTDIYQNVTKLHLSDAETRHLLSVYQKDLKAVSCNELINEFPVGSIIFISKDTIYYAPSPLYESFTATYNYLKELGYAFPTSMEPEKIEHVEIQNYASQQTAIFSDQKKIARLLPYLTFIPNYTQDPPFEVSVTFKQDIYTSTHTFYLKSANLPEDVQSMLPTS